MVIFIEWADGGSDVIRDIAFDRVVSQIFKLYSDHHNNIYRLDLCDDSGIIVKTYVKGGRWIG